jgi:predicted nuclease of predicted toxin-antitoxin system
MRFLFDQSADFRLLSHLRDLGHDVTAISRDHPHGLADEEVLEVARREKRILVVSDQDFGELVFQQGHGHAGVILFRLPGASLAEKARRFDAVLADHEENLLRGDFLVVMRHQVRVAAGPPR